MVHSLLQAEKPMFQALQAEQTAHLIMTARQQLQAVYSLRQVQLRWRRISAKTQRRVQCLSIQTQAEKLHLKTAVEKFWYLSLLPKHMLA